METLTVGSLFAGIGGFDLGFERAGFKVKWQVEIDPYCRKVLERHFPDAERFTDVREVGKHNLKPVDVLCGGFPCQDISAAGKGAGIEGARSGLWREYARIIGELRPRYAVVENVPMLFVRGITRVLGDLAEIGYDAEWQVISAADVGAPHLRKRVWIVAYDSQHRRGQGRSWGPASVCSGQSEQPLSLADSNLPRLQGWKRTVMCERSSKWTARTSSPLAESSCELPHGGGEAWGRRSESSDRRWWEPESGVGGTFDGLSAWLDDWESGTPRVSTGVKNRVDRLRALGNAVVPQIPESIARQILEYEAASE